MKQTIRKHKVFTMLLLTNVIHEIKTTLEVVTNLNFIPLHYPYKPVK